jgi:hypothetical protein
MDSKDDISKALNKASKSTERSLRSRLDEYYNQIEEAISSGVTHQTIIEILNEKGIEIGINSFRSALKALRKKHNYQAIKPDTKKTVVSSFESKPKNSETSLSKDSIKEIKNTEDEIDLDDLAKIGRQRMKDKLKENKK